MTDTLPIVLIGLLIQFLMFYYASYWAGAEQRRLARIQVNLLQEIARKQGVSEEAISEAAA